MHQDHLTETFHHPDIGLGGNYLDLYAISVSSLKADRILSVVLSTAFRSNRIRHSAPRRSIAIVSDPTEIRSWAFI